MKTKAEAFASYVNRSDIQTLLSKPEKKCSWERASRAFKYADEIDDAELGKWRIEPNMVRIESVLKVTGISLDVLKAQIEVELLMKQIKSGLPHKDTA